MPSHSSSAEAHQLELGPLAALVSSVGGVIEGLEQLGPRLTFSGDTVTLARLGDVGALRDGTRTGRFGVELDGIGCHPDPAVSALVAVVEALERYAAAVCDERRFTVASARDLGVDAIDLDGLVSCSERELASPGCRVVRFHPGAEMRWTRGWSLLTGRELWVPAVMAQLGIGAEHPGERFWVQSSSGCAAGESIQAALLGACRELVERDAVELAWLQRLPLPRLDPAARGDGWQAVRTTLATDRDGARIALLDATTDLGIPTAIAVLTPRGDASRPPAVGAACADSLALAALKAVREVAVVRACLWGETAPPPPAEIPAEAFDDLLGLGDRRRTSVAALPASHLPEADVASRLRLVVSALGRDCADVAAVDLTPIELRDTGLHVVRVIAPALIPFLAPAGARWLASPRLYEAPRRMGDEPLPEREVNPWPSPLW